MVRGFRFLKNGTSFQVMFLFSHSWFLFCSCPFGFRHRMIILTFYILKVHLGFADSIRFFQDLLEKWGRLCNYRIPLFTVFPFLQRNPAFVYSSGNSKSSVPEKKSINDWTHSPSDCELISSTGAWHPPPYVCLLISGESGVSV